MTSSISRGVTGGASRRRVRRGMTLLAASALALAACGSDAGGGTSVDPDEDPAEFFEGSTITWVIPYGAGGGFDLSSRLLVPYLEEELGATIVVQNEPGAGGLLGLNNLNRAKADGLTIGIMNGPGAVTAAIAEIDAVQFEFDQLEKLAQVGSSNYFLMTAGDGSLQTFEDVQAAGTFDFASTGRGSTDFITANVLQQAFDLDGDVVTGFESAPEGHLAVIRGDVDGMAVGRSGATDAHLGTGDAQMVVAFERERFEDHPDVPTVLELGLEGDQLAIVEAHLDVLAAYKVAVAPPGVPESRLAFLRDAFETVLNNPEVIERAADQSEPIQFRPGDELAEALNEIFLNPPALYKQIVTESLQ